MTAILIFILKVFLCLLLLGTRESGLDKLALECKDFPALTTIFKDFQVHANPEVKEGDWNYLDDWSNWSDWDGWDNWDDWEDQDYWDDQEDWFDWNNWGDKDDQDDLAR